MIALDEGCYGIPVSIATPRYYWISDACILHKLLNQSLQSPLKICTSFLFLLLHLCIYQYHIVHVSLSSRITPYVCHYAQRHIFYNHSMSDMSFHTSSPPNPFISCDAHSWQQPWLYLSVCIKTQHRHIVSISITASTSLQLATQLLHPSSTRHIYGTTLTPTLLACAITLLHNPSNVSPLSLNSVCLIFAISQTCFKLISPTVSFPLLPFNLPLTGSTLAALNNNHEVTGVRTSKWKERSGRTVTRAGIGVPG